MAADLGNRNADLLHVAAQNDRGVELRLDVVASDHLDRRVRVGCATQRGHAEADGHEVRALVEQRLDVVVRGREGGYVHLHAGRADHQGVDVVLVELPALARLKGRKKVRQLVADAEQGALRRHVLAVVEGIEAVDRVVQRVAGRGERGNRLLTYLPVQGSGELGHEPLAAVGRGGEVQREERVVERVRGLLLDVLF